MVDALLFLQDHTDELVPAPQVTVAKFTLCGVSRHLSLSMLFLARDLCYLSSRPRSTKLHKSMRLISVH